MSSAIPSLSFDELPRGAGGVGAAEQIAKTLSEQGVNATIGLYDEALAFAREGHLAQSAERLRMSLVLDPNDAEAAVLLGKVQAGLGKYQEALGHLDAAAAKGAVLPTGLRDVIEGFHHAKNRAEEEARSLVTQRDKSEVRNLRAEAKRLRAENSDLEGRVEDLNKRVKMWAHGTAVIGGVAAALVLAVMAFGGPSEPAAVVPEGPAVAAVEGAGVPVATVSAEAAGPVPTATPISAGPAPTATPVSMTPVGLPTSTPVSAAPVATPVAAAPVATPVAGAPGMTASVVKPASGTSASTNKMSGTYSPVSPASSAPAAKPAAAPAASSAKAAAGMPTPMGGAGKAPVAKKPETPVVAVKATHTVRKGETLGAISAKYYKDAGQWQRILKANPQLKGTNGLQPGMKLKIPK